VNKQSISILEIGYDFTVSGYQLLVKEERLVFWWIGNCQAETELIGDDPVTRPLRQH
jgi:hypothetical protein